MKSLSLTVLMTTCLSAVTASAASSSFTCRGVAEYGSIRIKSLVVTSERMNLVYVSSNGGEISKNYRTTEFMQKNGSTDLNKTAYLIGGTKSGLKTDYDDISLPHFGQYKSGLGSEIAFNHGADRVFGTVTCVQNSR